MYILNSIFIFKYSLEMDRIALFKKVIVDWILKALRVRLDSRFEREFGVDI